MTEITGLTKTEVANRVALGQVNRTDDKTSRSYLDIVRANVFTKFNALIGTLFVTVILVGAPIDALFALIAVINSAIGIFQEIRAKITLDRLAILNAPTIHAIRDSQEVEISTSDIVLDDTIRIRVGDQISADGEIISSHGLEIDESLLTGESDPVFKHATSKVLSGSIVVAGNGCMRVTAVGRDSYAYQITSQAKRFQKAHSELMAGINKILTYVAWTIVIVAPLLIWGQIYNGDKTWQEAVVRSIAAIVGMVPEGLVLLTSMAFMLATLALVRQKVLVQQLPAVEGLARVNMLLLDKTGTLTEGKIKFDEIITSGTVQRTEVLRVLAIMARRGDSPTNEALRDGFDDLSLGEPSSEITFSSSRKWSSISYGATNWILGAPEVLFAQADSPLKERADDFADQGKRVLVLMHNSSTLDVTKPLPDDLIPSALIVLSEKIRPDAHDSLQYFERQGVTLKVISGDSPRTVLAVSQAVGMGARTAFDARNLPEDDDAFTKIVTTEQIFGRVSPEQKRRIVQALQQQGNTVAMTGDGVNDTLALKDADIGIAMTSGAHATKAVAELVLLDNKFSRLPKVLAEGRRVMANIERVANLFLMKNVYSILLALAVTVLLLPYPFLPRHMSVISSLTIGIPAFFLALAPNSRRYQSGFLGRVLKFAIPAGIILAGMMLGSYLLSVNVLDVSANAASTLTAIVVMMMSAWILICLARPLRGWKILLIFGLQCIFAALILVPRTRELLHYEIVWPQILISFGIGALGMFLIHLLWKFDQRKVTSTP
ncbi:HAD-IC family P-type ATPase [Lysinibacter sp. HNR]|uniref:HAD-IC family P-type ATPase n=1 Tax=Lysinibacter sp. HNR TaxID=3031408 RepID=UPI002435FCD9|nr:HAD-IC family P-type ATPase [Lysinibacter sp. HNR]WGD38520.1 HAD-IC family P-type ATPase [Lysinibacter sp. HNR]